MQPSVDPKIVLVTGSSGRVGAAVCRELLARGYAVRGLDRVAHVLTTYCSELDHRPTLRAALSGVDAVIHCAALHAPHVGQIAASEFERINVRATMLLADLAVDAGVRQFVFTSTTALYGHAAEQDDQCSWIDLHTMPQPHTIYHDSKLRAELALESLARTGALHVSILRMSRCFPEPAEQMAIYRLHRGIDVRDVAGAHALALTHPTTFRRWLVSATPAFTRVDLDDLHRRADTLIRQRCPDLAAIFDRYGWPLPRRIDRVYDPSAMFQETGWNSRFGWPEVMRQWAAGSPEVLGLPVAC